MRSSTSLEDLRVFSDTDGEDVVSNNAFSVIA